MKQFFQVRKVRGADKVLTEVDLTTDTQGASLSALIAQKLGTVNQFHRMVSLKEEKSKSDRSLLNRRLLATLQTYGLYQTKGLAGQQPLPANAWANKTLEEIIKKGANAIVVDSKENLNILDQYFTIKGQFDLLTKKERRELTDPEKRQIEEFDQIRTKYRLLSEKVPFPMALVEIGKAGDPNLVEALDSYAAGKSNPKTKGVIQKWLSTVLLERGPSEEAYLNHNRYMIEIRSFSSKPDPWQEAMIESANQGKSILALTPTGSGKTYTALSLLYLFLDPTNKKLSEEEIIVYVAPTFDLALQTYNNLIKTFPRYSTSLMTPRLSNINQKTKIWVGTPLELWIYFQSMNIKTSIMFIDEIHTLSLSFGEGDEARLRSEAMGNLLTLCKKQLIGLSATVHDADIPVLCRFIQTNTGIDIAANDDKIIYHREKIINLFGTTDMNYDDMMVFLTQTFDIDSKNTITLSNALSSLMKSRKALVVDGDLSEFKLFMSNTVGVSFLNDHYGRIVSLYQMRDFDRAAKLIVSLFNIELSLTDRVREELRKMVDSSQLVGRVKFATGLLMDPSDKTNVIIHRQRIVPQQNMQWVGDTYQVNSQRSRFVESDVSPAATFNLIQQMIKDDMTPALIFDTKPKECFTNYAKYIEWLEKREAENYVNWHGVNSKFGDKLINYNMELNLINQQIDALEDKPKNFPKIKALQAERNAKFSGPQRILTKSVSKYLRDAIVGIVLAEYQRTVGFKVAVSYRDLDITKGSEINQLLEPSQSDRLRQEKSFNGFKVGLTKDDYEVIRSFFKREIFQPVRDLEDEDQIELELPADITSYFEFDRLGFGIGSAMPVELHDLITVLKDWESAARFQGIKQFQIVCDNIGPFFNNGASNQEIAEIISMFDRRNTGLKIDRNQSREEILALCRAEKIELREIEPLLVGLIAKGLKFGVGFILPTLPFAVHFNMLKLISAKKVPILFTSKDMSMGINYPIRTAVIRANQPTEMNVCEYLQMAGRSGRRGFDKIGNVISWNIINALTCSQETLPQIVIPTLGIDRGCQIPNPIELAMKIEHGRIYSMNRNEGTEMINQSLDKINRRNGATVKQTSSKSKKQEEEEEEEEEEEDQEEEEFEGNSSGIKSSGPAVIAYDDNECVSSISACVIPLAEVMGISTDDIITTINRIGSILSNDMNPSMKEDVYLWAQKIGLIKIALQEIHIKLHRSKNIEWLQLIESVYNLLYRVQLIQLSLEKVKTQEN